MPTFRALRNRNFALLPLGFAFTSWLMDRMDIAIIFILAGGVTALLSMTPLFHSQIRELD